MIEVADDRAGDVIININQIHHVEKDRYGGMTYIVMENGRTFKVYEDYETIKEKIFKATCRA